MSGIRRRLLYGAVLVLAFGLLLLTAGQPLTDWWRRQAYRQPGEQTPTSVPERTSYAIIAEFDPAQRLLTARQEVSYRTPADLVQSLVLHLYPNAFARDDALPQPRITGGHVPEQLLPGNITIKSLKLNGATSNYTIDGTILEVPLAYWHLPGTAVRLELEYDILVPVSVGRLGLFRGTALFGNWYPVLAVNERGSWRRDPYYPLGDPFYSETADYQVQVSMPIAFQAVATGNEVARIEQNNRVIYSWRAENVRDFAWSASDEYRIVEKRAGDVLVRSAFFGDGYWGELALDLAVRAIEVYERLFGPYPYPVFTVAEAQLRIFGGMEYPGFIVMSPYGQRETRVAESARIEREIAHETAHQWWYAAVGNDQIHEPWLDEATTTYFAALYFAEVYGPQELDTFRTDRYVTPNLPVASPLPALNDWRTYWLTVYVKGSYLLDELSLRLGQDLFLQLMREYYLQFSGRLADTDDFLGVIRQVAGQEHADWFAERLKQPNGAR